MSIFQKIYDIGKYAMGVLAIAALYSCTEPVNNQKKPEKNQEAGQTLDAKVNEEEKYDLIIKALPLGETMKLKKGEIVEDRPHLRYLGKKEDNALIFKVVEDFDKLKKGERFELEFGRDYVKHFTDYDLVIKTKLGDMMLLKEGELVEDYPDLKYVGKDVNDALIFEHMRGMEGYMIGRIKKGTKFKLEKNKDYAVIDYNKIIRDSLGNILILKQEEPVEDTHTRFICEKEDGTLVFEVMENMPSPFRSFYKKGERIEYKPNEYTIIAERKKNN